MPGLYELLSALAPVSPAPQQTMAPSIAEYHRKLFLERLAREYWFRDAMAAQNSVQGFGGPHTYPPPSLRQILNPSPFQGVTPVRTPADPSGFRG